MVQSWDEYRARYGIISEIEKSMPLDRAANLMHVLSAIIQNANLHLSVNERGLLLSSDRRQVKKEEEKDFHDETYRVIDILKNIYATLPSPFESRTRLNEVVIKQINIIGMTHLFLRAYSFQFYPDPPELPINPFKFNPRFFELGTKKWEHLGSIVLVIIKGALIFTQGGIGLKILLGDANSSFAEASFYESGDCLRVIDINSLVPKDPIANKYVFIELITHVIFNIWEMQKNENLALFYRVSNISSAGLGFNRDHVENADQYKQQINYKREECISYFGHFDRILALTFPIVPENSLIQDD